MIEKIRNKIKELLSYKFKVRIKQHMTGSTSYRVQYAYYRFIPIYYTLNKWLKYGGGYNPIMGNYKEAKFVAEKMKTYNDILEFQRQQEELSEIYPENKHRYDSIKITTPAIEQIL